MPGWRWIMNEAGYAIKAPAFAAVGLNPSYCETYREISRGDEDPVLTSRKIASRVSDFVYRLR